MTTKEAKKILLENRPDRPRSMERRRLQKAIDTILEDQKATDSIVEEQKEVISEAIREMRTER